MNWLKQLFSRRRIYTDLSTEIQAHLEEKIEELVAQGLSRHEAAAAARRQFGNVTLVQEESRAVWRWSSVENFLTNIRYALRALRKAPGFTAIVVVTLALGIGATTAIYSVTYATLLAPMPYPQPDRLVMVWPQVQGRRIWGTSAGDFLDWKKQSTVFEDLNAMSANGGGFNLALAGHVEHVVAQVATPGHYSMMGISFMLGRSFLPEEGTLGKDHVVILSYKIWNHFGADNNIVGRQLRMNGELYTVVGVTAPGPVDRINFDIVVPLTFKPEQINHGYHWLFVMGRLKPGVSLAEAQAEMTVIAHRLELDNPQTNKDWKVSVEPLQDDFLSSDTKITLWLLLGAVCFVLCIACVNVANLLLSRSATRQREVAVRISLGASRGQIFAQFLTESLVLAIAGGVAGVLLAEVLLKMIVAILPAFTLPSEADLQISLPVLLFALLVTLSAGVIFGCAPAWQASGVDPNHALKETAAVGMSAGRRRLRQTLVVMEFGLALTLLAGAGLTIHSFWNLTHVPLGVRTDHILTFFVPVAEGHLLEPEREVAFYREFLEKIRSLPGVSSAVVSTGLPVEGPHRGTQFRIVGTPEVDPRSRPFAAFQSVTPGYFEAFGIPIVKGRSFTEQDTSGSTRVAVVNENFVRRFFPNVDPLTQRILVDRKVPGVQTEQPVVEWQIVGVFRNVRSFGLRESDVPELDVPFWQSPWPQTQIAVRTASDPAALTRTIGEAVTSMDSDLPLAHVQTMTQIVDARLASDRFTTVLYGGFAALALVLAAVGIYGVMAFAVSQRTHEIGLRMALGAGSERVLRMVLREGMILAFLGLALGLFGAFLVGRVLHDMLYSVAAMDYGVFAAVAFTLLASAYLACYLPARRAAKLDPMIALRYE